MANHADAEERNATGGGVAASDTPQVLVGLGAGGAAWVDRPVRLQGGFRATVELTSLWPGSQMSLIVTRSTRWHLSPLDAFPGDLPPSTVVVRVARVDIDRGVYDLKVLARGPEGPTVCLGESRGDAPHP